MLAKTSFPTYERQDYIDAAIANSSYIKSRILNNQTTFAGVKGPLNAGKSLFFDALIHCLVDDLDTNTIPVRSHMMLEKSGDEALRNETSKIFNIESVPIPIGFTNIICVKDQTISELKKISRKPGLHLFSFQTYAPNKDRNDLYAAINFAALHEISSTGEGLKRNWQRYTPLGST